MYEYDVFISYQRSGHDVPAWVRNHFHPRLTEVLDNNLYRDVKVFLDDQIPTGANWPGQLRSALLRTRVLVPVCSPKYFKDEWCLAEWHSMAKREELAGDGHPRQLIYPVIFCDSWNFPDYASERRMRDLHKWSQPFEHYQATPEYIGFNEQIGQIAKELEELIELAPDWRADWPVLTPAPEPPKRARMPRF
ncbi:toll/interleukin-1 receptor domain-containing protein [Amycolatopsis nalaikhensis]|uniref:Toll/interleukin-1 receptor domain-containing protein n=1 Tax=Amycolatopsis nalaikhensis TaxID=715472 RepID=A0ABY8XHU0_9PSEU|nr:toll/interleukin-1 receptor domain-containing protein [Amycolatopsis sp. 2-2]WIV55188.1 toll/interleukin-1 receptor domain-containing protein [Amycolatopsis sp. 2-2]